MHRWLPAVTACVLACGGSKDKPPVDAAAVPPKPSVADAAATPSAIDAAATTADAGGPASAPAGATSKALSVTVRGRVACARRADGRVRCWGRNDDGTAAPIAAAPVELPKVDHAVALDISPKGAIYVVTSEGKLLRTFAELTKLSPLEEVPQQGEVIDVRFLEDTPYALMRTGNLEGPLASNPKLTDVIAVRTSGPRGLALHRDGHVTAFSADKATVVPGLRDIESLIAFGCGRRRGGQVTCWDAKGKALAWKGPGNIVDRIAGDHFSCDLTSSGVACTGWNDVGQLGTGPGPDRATPKLVDLPGKPVALSVGDRSACAALDTGDVACWGGNDGGQLGDRTLIDRAKPVVIAGVTSADPPPPGDGTGAVQQASQSMSWDGFPTECKRPDVVATIDPVASAYAYATKSGAELWFADFHLEPGGQRGKPVRAAQRAAVITLAAKGAVDRGRYHDQGARRASVAIHDISGATKPAKVDLVVEKVDKTWICGQLLAPRQPFAARFEKRLR